jgi:hypothetical protein
MQSNENDWFTKDRSETASNRLADRILSTNPNVTVINPAVGINIYRGAMSKELQDNIINTLEDNLNGQNPMYRWNGALVTESTEVISEVRNCVDFKISTKNLGPRNSANAALYDMHEATFQALRQATEDYGRTWGVGILFFESFNYVKYDGPGTRFKIHADHGPSYISTTSVVAYVNDDYEGGEIYFPRFDVKIKPQAGDIVVFPSTYVYEHSSEDIVSGTKYSVVVMTDYNDRNGNRTFDYSSMDHTKYIY